MQERLPLFYFKPTICVVDDDQLFLQAFSLSLQHKYHFKFFAHPEEAIDFFTGYESKLTDLMLKKSLAENDFFGATNCCPIEINIAAIKDILHLTQKEQEIVALIVDYHMPCLNGIEFCQQISSVAVKKILLTGAATADEAVVGFNLGLITKFLKKDYKVTNKLPACLKQLAINYFYDKTTDIIAALDPENNKIFTDPVFIKFFLAWVEANNIEEFYLINNQGSFIVKDRENKISFFIVMSDSDNLNFLALNDEMPKDNMLLKKVAAGELIPFFGLDREYWQVELKHWEHYFYPANVIRGKENYYWAVVENSHWLANELELDFLG